jgi:hypothetical protein
MSDSQGLVIDAAIVCNITKNLTATPNFYFETFDDMDGIIFVNLDTTEFNSFNKKIKTPSIIACKTLQTFNSINNRSDMVNNHKIVYTGFTSIDRYIPDILKDYRKFIHVPGKSPYKGTITLLETWSRHPEWPILTVISRSLDINSYINMKNINIYSGFLSESELSDMINKHGIHICSSKHEGFGHYIHEAKSMACVVLYTNASSMNESFSTDLKKQSGIPIEFITSTSKDGNGICGEYHVSIESIEKAVMIALNKDVDELEKIGMRAREEYLRDSEIFKENVLNLLRPKPAEKIPKIIHYMWISKDDEYIDVILPKKNQKYVDSWKLHNPDYTMIYWSGNSIFTLISQFFPNFIEAYTKITPTISKCDFARFAIMYVYGGVYSDVDFICNKSLNPLLNGYSYYIFEPIEHSEKPDTKYLLNKAGCKNMICNGFFASVKNTSFIYGWLETMISNMSVGCVMEKTGPIGFSKYYHEGRRENQKAEMPPFIGITCDILPILTDGTISKEFLATKNTESYMQTIWTDGSGWS